MPSIIHLILRSVSAAAGTRLEGRNWPMRCPPNDSIVTRIAPAIGLWLIAAALIAAAPAPAEDSAAARLTHALAIGETRDGRTSPYLLPVIEELAQLRRRDGALGEAVALRRRALDIAVATFGSDSPSTAEAMAALALIDIELRRYLDAEPLLIIAERVLGARVAADHPV